MSLVESPYFIYILLMCGILAVYLLSSRRKETVSQEIKKEQQEAGLMEPASLHPVIDPAICMGCAACVPACPEKDVIGIIHHKAELITPANCIGHGACATACPVDAITLVFGSEKRGVDIPCVSPDFETNVPGIYIAGELGGMGLIRNAVEQGRQAMASIAQRIKASAKTDGIRDVIIVGAGPAGFSASLAALEKGLTYATLEQDSLGGTVSNYPRGKIVMTQPATLPIIGTMPFRETTKEALIDFWRDVEARTRIQINYHEHVRKISAGGQYIETITDKASYKSKTVLLAIGRRGTPRKLNVPGETLSKVVYKLIDPAQYAGRHILVVGGGDSALEAALALVETPETTVTLSYRGDAFSRAKKKNRDRVDDYRASGKLSVLLTSTVRHISEGEVMIVHKEQERLIQNDAVIVCAGGVLPTEFLKEIGIEVETKYGTA